MPAVRAQGHAERRRLALVVPAALALFGGAGAEPHVVEMRVLMGTTAEVRVGGLVEPVRGLDAAFAALERIDERMSLWRKSELVLLNEDGERAVSEDTFAVIRHALEVAAASGGAFDPTVEPLVEVGGRPAPLPAGARTALERVSYRLVRLDPRTRSVRLERRARLTLDGLAKGYGADLALAALRSAGAASGLVDLGGSSLAVFGEPLRLGVRDPAREEAPWAELVVEDAAVSTSGGDERSGHIVDPRTGMPARGVLQVTVVAATALEADALSTAAFVLGREEGLALLVRRGAAGLVLEVEGGRRRIRTTPGFSAAYRLRARAGIEVSE
jgi:thiamine biosynthesis lipoprotein